MTEKELDEWVRQRLFAPQADHSPSPDAFRNKLTFFIVGSFIGILPMFVFWGMPQTSKDIVTYMVGQISGMATMALGFYFTNKVGQDALDAKRSDTTAKMAEAVSATVKAAPIATTSTKPNNDMPDTGEPS